MRVNLLGASSSYGERVRLEILNGDRMYLVLAISFNHGIENKLGNELRRMFELYNNPLISSPDGNRPKGFTGFMLKPPSQSLR